MKLKKIKKLLLLIPGIVLYNVNKSYIQKIENYLWKKLITFIYS